MLSFVVCRFWWSGEWSIWLCKEFMFLTAHWGGDCLVFICSSDITRYLFNPNTRMNLLFLLLFSLFVCLFILYLRSLSTFISTFLNNCLRCIKSIKLCITQWKNTCISQIQLPVFWLDCQQLHVLEIDQKCGGPITEIQISRLCNIPFIYIF